MQVLILQTGGTIDKDYPKRNQGYAFEITESAAFRVTKRIQSNNVDFKVKTICKLDSQDINDQHRKELVAACKSSKVERILITHGTDSLIETARFLERYVTDKFIVLTGSFKPETFKDSDAEFNIGFSLGCLTSLSQHGVFIAINCSLFKPCDVIKDKETGNFVQKE